IRPSASDLIMKIRPRGESISVPRSENVGQYARQRPQCTHWFTPSTVSPCRASDGVPDVIRSPLNLDVPWPSNISHETAGIEDVARVELALDPLHDPSRGARVVPHTDGLFHGTRRGLEHGVAGRAARDRTPLAEHVDDGVGWTLTAHGERGRDDTH